MTPQPQQQIYQIDRMVNSFSRLMKMKLHENLHKGTWENRTYDYLRSRIDDELKEFDVAIEEGRYIDATVEAADIGNFLAMIRENIDFGRFDNYTRTSRPAPSPLEKVLLCFGNYWECPIDEEECEVSDPCHQKAIRDMEHDKQVKRKAREEVLNEMRDLVRNAKKYGTIEPEELFHWTGVIAMIESLRSEVKKP